MSEVTVAPELLQQLAHLANAASEPMMVDEGVEMSAAIREIASQVKGRTEILAGAVQSVATSTDVGAAAHRRHPKRTSTS